MKTTKPKAAVTTPKAAAKKSTAGKVTKIPKAVATTAADAITTKSGKDRWPPSVMKRGYTAVPTILLWGQGKLGLTPEELNVLLQLISHWWIKSENPHPSKATIARRMNKDPRTIQRHLTSLEGKKIIRRQERRKVHKGQDSNGYDLRGLIKKLEEIVPEFDKAAEQNKRRRAKAETK
jgi:predicted transcriptional regulator